MPQVPFVRQLDIMHKKSRAAATELRCVHAFAAWQIQATCHTVFLKLTVPETMITYSDLAGLLQG